MIHLLRLLLLRCRLLRPLRPLLQGSNAGEEKNRLRPGRGCCLLCLPLRALQGNNAGEKMNRLRPGRGRGLLCLLRPLQGNNAGEKMLDGKLRARQGLVVVAAALAG